MKKYIISISLIIAFMAFPTRVFAKNSSQSIVRIAFLVGSNSGGKDRVKLLYSHTDTKSVAGVFQELGGVSSQNTYMLLEPDLNQIVEKFEAITKRVETLQKAGNQVHVIFYYSGHSDDTGLLPGGDKLTYKKLRALLKNLKSDVTIGILDSCSSGAITRTKGGKWVPSFLSGTPDQTRGEVFLTSSSASENAQESDKLKGSYFTHYLVSGLRGAADKSNDQRVTIGEAYQYAFSKTLSSTESTSSGPQHPNYAFRLAGTGDLVITELKRTKSKLYIPANVIGRISVRDKSGNVVSEVEKYGKMPLYIALRPGVYTVTFITGKTIKQGKITLNTIKVTMFDEDSLGNVPAEVSRLKGHGHGMFIVPVSVSFTPFLSVNRMFPPDSTNLFALNLLWEEAGSLHGLEISGLGSVRSGDVRGIQIAGLFNIALGHVTGAQISGLLNYSEKDSLGFLVAGFGNFTSGSSAGMQTGGLFNVNRGDFMGMQTAGIVNLNKGKTTGAMFAGLINLSSISMLGVQIAGIANITGDMKGFQTAGVANISRDVKGAQIAGVYNQAENVNGFQIGVVNKAKNVSGFQIGVVNISDSSSFSLGLVNIIKDGRYLLGATADTFKTGSVEFKHGGKHWHTIYSIASTNDEDDKFKFNYGIGFGTHLNAGPLSSIDIDAFVRQKIIVNDTYNFSTLRISLMHRISGNLHLMAGAGLSIFVFKGDQKKPDSMFNGWVLKDAKSNPDIVEVRMYPEITAGLYWQF